MKTIFKHCVSCLFPVAIMSGCASPTSTANVKTDEKPYIKVVYEGAEEEMGMPVMLLNHKGDTLAPMGKYSMVQDIPGNDLVLVAGEKGMVLVDVNGKELDYTPFFFDNAPDEVSEGMVRIVDKEGKMGYADSLWHVVVAPQFFFAQPWSDGYGTVALEGEFVNRGEHKSYKVDKWLQVDKDGKISQRE